MLLLALIWLKVDNLAGIFSLALASASKRSLASLAFAHISPPPVRFHSCVCWLFPRLFHSSLPVSGQTYQDAILTSWKSDLIPHLL